MKKILHSTLIQVLMGMFILLMSQCRPTTKSADPVEKKSFDQVTSKLDRGGNFYLYLGTEKTMNYINRFLTTLKDQILSEFKGSEESQEKLERGLSLMMNLVHESGFLDINGIGMSSITIEEKLYRNTIVLHRIKKKERSRLWTLFGEKPHILDTIDILPEDTILAKSSDFNLKNLWTWIKETFQNSGIPDLMKASQTFEGMLDAQGIDLNRLLDSLTGEIGFLLVLDKTKTTKIPINKQPMQIPEPSLAIMFSTQNDYIFNKLQEKIPNINKKEKEGIRTLEIPVPPLPLPLQPVIAQTDKRLILSTHPSLVDKIRAAKTGGNRLKNTKEFNRLARDLPQKGNGFLFIGSRLFETINTLQKKRLTTSEKMSEKEVEFFQKISPFPKAPVHYGIFQSSEDGFLAISNGNISLGDITIMLPATIVTGIVSAIAIPNFIVTLQKGKQKATMGDMRSISTAIESYIIDNDQAPQAKTLAELKEKLEPFYIKKLPLRDGWGNDFLYTHGSGENKQNYTIGSAGKDGVFNGWEQTGSYQLGNPKDFNNDIIIVNGELVFGPKVGGQFHPKKYL